MVRDLVRDDGGPLAAVLGSSRLVHSVLTGEDDASTRARIGHLAEQISLIHEHLRAGCPGQLESGWCRDAASSAWRKRPDNLRQLQAAAAVQPGGLTESEPMMKGFRRHGRNARDNFCSRTRISIVGLAT